MTEQFSDFQGKFKELFSSEVDHMITDLMDLKKSNDTFKKITGSTLDFEEVLNIKNVKKKKKHLLIQ
jgi:hypothetical protein